MWFVAAKPGGLDHARSGAACDISGQISQCSRMVLHFAPALASKRGQGRGRAQVFGFDTRMTRIARYLRHREVDRALKPAKAKAQDRSGGTRFGSLQARFNRDCSGQRRGRRGVDLQITTGLTARSLVHLPLLRWQGLAPSLVTSGRCCRMRTALAGRSTASLQALGDEIRDRRDSREKHHLMRLLGDSAP